MTDTPNLFTSVEFSEFKANIPEVVVTTRVVKDYWVTILGVKFDLEDLYTTLSEVVDGDVYITNDSMVKVLKKLGVITSGGSRSWGGAGQGENFKEFFGIIRDLYSNIPD